MASIALLAPFMPAEIEDWAYNAYMNNKHG